MSFPMPPKTIIDWREDLDAEPVVDLQAIENYIARRKNDPRYMDKDIFFLIEECNSWFRAYKDILHPSTMKIELDDDLEAIGNLRGVLDAGIKVKFVIIETADRIASLFVGHEHADEASALLRTNEGSIFVGAGVVQENFDIVWGSGTCEHGYGHSAPKENADKILAELKEAIMKLGGKK